MAAAAVPEPAEAGAAKTVTSYALHRLPREGASTVELLALLATLKRYGW